MPTPNHQLKNLRNKWNFTLRHVEEASRRIADAKGDRNYSISNSWLTQLEKGISMPNPCTMFSLCATYRVDFADILRLYGVDPDEIEKYQHIANPHLTQPIQETSIRERPEFNLLNALNEPVTRLVTKLPAPAGTNSKQHESKRHARYGYIGLNDHTMNPLIRPGAIVEIDIRQNKPRSMSSPNEFAKPIFFIELREGWACGWCEVRGNQLKILPHPLSQAPVRDFAYPREAEIVGRVVAYTTRCVDP